MCHLLWNYRKTSLLLCAINTQMESTERKYGPDTLKLFRLDGSTHHAAVKPLKKQFGKLITALETLTDHRDNVDTRGSAECLLKAVCDFSFWGFLSF